MYFDNTATTKTRIEVRKVMKKYFSSRYGNPSSIHKKGVIARGSVEMAREEIASTLGSDSNQIVFTSSGSEANNSAIFAALKTQPQKKHIISSRIEHSSIFSTFEQLSKEGYEVSYIKVDQNGFYDIEELKATIKEDTALVALSYANNEVGTIQYVKNIVSCVKKTETLLLLDGVQALPYIKFDLKKLGADFVSFSGHKLYAPKGIGLLYIKDPEKFHPLILGGGQERSLRSGTENVAYIVGLATAIRLNNKEKDKLNKHLQTLRDRIVSLTMKSLSGIKLTGDPTRRVPSIASFTVEGISGKHLVKKLATYGIAISSGSACSSDKNIPSRILNELGYDENYLQGSIRISLGKYNNKFQVNKLLKILHKCIESIRSEKLSSKVEMSFISQQEFSESIEDLQVIDVRPVPWPKLNINKMYALPIWDFLMKGNKTLKNLNKENPVVVICYDGDILGPEAQTILYKKGFNNVRVLSGGAKQYNSTGVIKV